MGEVLVLGNGFDLSVGLKTAYIDFFNSKYWPFAGKKSSMAVYLNNRFNYENWVDVEAALGDFATYPITGPQEVAENEEGFDLLKKHFNKYICNQQKTFTPNNDAYGARLLRAFIDDRGLMDYIFTFNFTDLSVVSRRLGIKRRFSYNHIHGRSTDGSAILGVGDSVKLVPRLDFMYKSFSRFYSPPLIIPALLEASRVIIYGVSLGPVDYQYFDDFFTNMTNTNVEEPFSGSKEIIIITKNKDSRRDILRNLQQMTDFKLGRIASKHMFRVYCTCEKSDRRSLEKLIDDVQNRYEHYENIKSLRNH